MAHSLRPPDFIVIGAMKAGTTAFHRWLSAHADIGVPRMKETDFFIPALNQGRSWSWYLRQFPDAPVRGEVAPAYAKARVFPGTPARIAARLPQARLIYLVRDPVGRAVSEYRHCRAAGLIGDPDLRDGDSFARLIDAGLYARQLSLYLAHFPMERILVLRAEDLSADPATTLARVARFLKLRDYWPDPRGHFNAGEDTARLPDWYWSARTSPAGRHLRAALPDPLKALLRRAARQRRAEMDVPPDLADRVADATFGDARRFARMTGIDVLEESALTL